MKNKLEQFTNRQLALKAGIDESNFHRYTSRRYSPSPETVRRMAEGWGVSREEVWEEIEARRQAYEDRQEMQTLDKSAQNLIKVKQKNNRQLSILLKISI